MTPATVTIEAQPIDRGNGVERFAGVVRDLDLEVSTGSTYETREAALAATGGRVLAKHLGDCLD